MVNIPCKTNNHSTIIQVVTKNKGDTMGMKGQQWVGGIIGGVIGIVIAAVVLFGQIGTIKSQIGNATLTTSETSLANLVPFVLIAGFVLLIVALFLRYK